MIVLKWKDIDTAPKDGKPFIMSWHDFVSEQAHWDIGTKQFVRWTWQRGPVEGMEHTPDPLKIEGAVWCELPQYVDESGQE